jgi:hypothetical protein
MAGSASLPISVGAAGFETFQMFIAFVPLKS